MNERQSSAHLAKARQAWTNFHSLVLDTCFQPRSDVGRGRWVDCGLGPQLNSCAGRSQPRPA